MGDATASVASRNRRGGRRRTLAAIAAGASVALHPRVRAQPTQAPVRLVVPFTPGGSTDIIARVLATRLGPALARNVLVENRPGAGGSIGAAEVARAAPTGDTLLMGHIGTLAVNPSLYRNLPYDPVKSFVPIAYVARVPNVLVVRPALGVATLGELVERATAQPARLTYGSGGNGSAAHLATAALELAAGIALTHVPYRGTAPAVNDVIAGQVDMIFTGAPAVLAQVSAGRLRALAVSSSARLASLPDVPTVAERHPGFEADQWYGVVAPAGTPEATVAALNRAIDDALALPDVVQALASQGAEPVRTTPAAFAALIARELPRWRDVVQRAHMTVD